MVFNNLSSILFEWFGCLTATVQLLLGLQLTVEPPPEEDTMGGEKIETIIRGNEGKGKSYRVPLVRMAPVLAPPVAVTPYFLLAIRTAASAVMRAKRGREIRD